jgi:hypothetical protein
MNKIKVLMNGPGRGHNIEKWINFFNENSDKYHLTFMSESEFTFNIQNTHKVTNLYTRSKKIINLLKSVFHPKYDLFVLHHGYSLKNAIAFHKIFRFDKSIFIPWGYKVVHKAIQEQGKKWGYECLIEKSDLITGNHHMNKLLANKYPQLDSRLYPFYWGLDEEWFTTSDKPDAEFTKKFLASITDNDIFIFYPRSILRLHRYDLIIEAIKQIKDVDADLVKKVKLVIWTGNANDKDYEKELKDLINKYNLSEQIIIQNHPYVGISDLKAIWSRCDFTLNILETDGFSTQISEAFLFKKPMIISNIPAYSAVNAQHGLKMDFVDNNVEDIKSILITFLHNYMSFDNEILEKRKSFVIEHMNFNRNVERLLNLVLTGDNT